MIGNRKLPAILTAAVVGLVILSCSSEDALQKSSAAVGGGIAAGAGGTGGLAGSTTVGSFVGSGGFYPTQELCPPDPPTDPSCPIWGQLCEYGDDPRIRCRRRFACVRPGPDPQGWHEFETGYCPPLDPSLCPLDPDTRTLCTDPEALCIYPDGMLCGCVSMDWYCTPPPDTGCPAVAPNFGQPCALEGKHCEYGDCNLGIRAIRACLNGVWTDLFNRFCP